MPPGTATVDSTADRVTVTACDPGSAATAIPNPPFGSLVYLSGRDPVRRAAAGRRPTKAGHVRRRTLVRDPVFAPIVTAAGADPNAAPDPASVAALRARVQEIVAQCGARPGSEPLAAFERDGYVVLERRDRAPTSSARCSRPSIG